MRFLQYPWRREGLGGSVSSEEEMCMRIGQKLAGTALTIVITMSQAAVASIPEPSAIFFGSVRIGDSQGVGVLEARRGEELISTSELSLEGRDASYVLEIPVVHLLPGEIIPPDDALQLGERVDLYLNGINIETPLLVSDRGMVTNIHLSMAGFVGKLTGRAAGGDISALINDARLIIETSAGQPAEAIVAALVIAIETDPDLAEVAATAVGDIFTTNADVAQFAINDPGLRWE